MLQPRLSVRMTRWSFFLCAVLLSTLVRCQEINEEEQIESSRMKREGVPDNRAFNTNGIIYDNTPWKPGNDAEAQRAVTDDGERKLNNLATRIMSNGVEVLVKDKNTDGKYEQTKYMEVKTIQPSSPTKVYMSSFPKADKRIDNEDDSPYDLIQPSEVSHASCTTSCSCSSTKTEGLQTKYPNRDVSMGSYNMKTSKYGSPVLDLRPTNKEQLEKKTQYGPYEYETSSQVTPTDRIVEKYTEVINDYSDEKDSSVVNESELLTNEQAPTPTKTNKVNNKTPEKSKPEKQKPNKNKFVVADLLKLGTLGIKGLTQLAPVIEKMTGGFIKRQETTNKVTTTTIKPAVKLTAYNVDKRVDSEMESKHNNFPIYIPVDELETSESQMIYTNATLHQNLVWAAEHKQPKAHIVPPKIIHESPLVNGGIPISPGEIITANSDVIVGKPAVGGPLTLAASGIKLQNPVSPPPIDSFVAANEQYLINEKPLSDQGVLDTKVDDSYDLRPPGLPNMKPKPNRPLNAQRPSISVFGHQNKMPPRLPPTPHISNDQLMKTEHIKSTTMVLGNHGRPAFLDYIPSLAKPVNTHIKHQVNFKPVNKGKEPEVPDNSPSSSEIVNTQIRTEDEYGIAVNPESNKPFLVDIQPSRVANVLIPHGSSTALVFAGSSEPHKTGDYVDDPLPYPEPGYFGSFSIDAPQMTNVHNVAPNSNKQYAKPNFNNPQDHYKPNIPPFKEHSIRNDLKIKWKDNKRPGDYNRIPPPTSNQETHVQVGPQITSYNPDIFSPTNGDFDKYNKVKGNDKPKDGKKIIDKEYENYLAVPPPPPKMIFNQDNSHDKLKPYQQRPIVHTKPVQDMKVFLNIQHPVPQEQMPPKVTSEIYFAAQAPNNKPSPTYTIHIPPAKDSFVNTFNKPTNNIVSTPMHTDVNQAQNHFSIVSSPNIANTSQITHNDNDKENTYTVTLNTATNVASNVGEVSQVIGSSVPVPIGSTNVGLNTDIPIGINFAIRVEDNRPSLETYNLQEDQRKPIVYDEHGRVPINVSVEDNRWNTSSIEKEETTIVGHNYYHKNVNAPPRNDYNNRPIMPPSLNSHANFPMMNEDTTAPPKDLKPVVEYMDDVKFTDQKRPAKLIPNIPTNSHGWYSSVLNENNINQIKVEATTRKVIPIHDYNEKDSIPDFGEKITSAGKPPTEIWTKNQHILPNFNIGKPFTKVSTTEKTYSSIPPLTTKPYASNNYIPSNLNAMQQPAYDIPIRDNSDETTTSTQKPKPVYENSEEVYDGEEEQESTYDTDGAISLESMKIPVVSSEVGTSTSTEITLLQDEVLNNSKENHNNKLSTFNPGTQTEKPFRTSNNISFQSNAIKPVYANNYYNMKPRPFTVNTALVLDHQLQQPHWQINHMMENSSNASYEENIDLNIGEEMNAPSTTKPSVQRIPLRQPEIDDKYTQSFRPVFTRTNGTQVLNESNIITSTVHIKDKKPLIVEKATEKSTMPTFTIRNEVEFNKTSSEIVDLSPPPPTMDYNFKPSTNDEMIMGMSPPPPRNTPAGRPPVRVPLTPRPIPVRTPPSYRPKPQRTLPPRLPTQRPVRKPARDEVSTYRPHVRDDAHTHRPIRDEVSTYRPLVRDEISTYRPAYDILNNIRRPVANRDQPSSQLLPPPRETPSKVITPVTEISSPTISQAPAPNLVFPTPTSSGWLTSSGFDFSSSFNFAPTSIQFPETSKPSTIPDLSDVSSSENSYSYEVEYSSEKSDELPSEKPISTEDKPAVSKEVTDSTTKTSSSTETNVSDSFAEESAEDTATDKIKIIPLGHKNRIRKPYPIRNDDRKTTTSKFKLPSKPTSTIRPTRTLARPDIVYPTRHTSIKKIVRPIPTRIPPVVPPSIIESSESAIDEELIRPTEVLRDSVIPTPQIEISGVPNPSSTLITPTLEVNISPIVQPVHHAGNEIKISDETIPTKTEFRTTVITLTKTLSEPPTTISSVDYVNLTHTLTVTHTKTSLVSQSDGAVTETLVLTNTQTSTIVDVVTEIRTQVQPTTIIETVTKHIPVPQVEPTPVQEIKEKTKEPLDDISMSSEENDNLIIRDNEVTENVQKIEVEGENDNDTFFVVMNKSQNGGQSPPVNTEVETGDYDGITRNEQVNSNGVSQVLFGEILLAGAPYLETTNVGNANECHPDCKASRNERCQRIDGIMKCVCRPGFARMFPDRPCKPTYTYSVKLALDSQGSKRLRFHQNLSDNSSKEYQALAVATHEGINRMVMQSDLRDVFHGVHITGFHPVEMKESGGDLYQGVMNHFYVQLSDNAHESRLKEVIEKYLRNNNYSLGGTDVHAAGELVDRLDVSDFDECTSVQFHDCSEHAQCFNLRGTYTCSCLEGYADLSVNNLYPGRICSTEPVGCERCNYHGACYSRDDRRVLCECFQWYAGSTCQINLKVVLISLVVAGAVLTAILTACAIVACRRSRPPQRSIVACIQSMPALHQGAMPSKQRQDRRALISERGDAADASSIQNASLPYMPVKRPSSTKKMIMSEPPAHDPPPPPAPAVMIPRARLHPHHGDSRENISRKRSLELSSEAKLISYLESGASANHEEMRRKHSLESSYSANKDRHNKQGALVSAGFKVSTTIRGDEVLKDDRDDLSSINKGESDGDIGRFDSLRKSYSQEDLSEWTDAERRLGELTLSEARSVGGTLPASTGRAASSMRLTHQEANTMAERDLGSTFLLPHVHLYKPDLTSDVSEFDSL
ncbi:uncharacterized protein LOC115452868 isoform X2 [Manduca sexta]|uniref:uncharacterized protein LOC115452868 isoform X2 n=1 Tax=Manduca sexta TaxID=7130 RepID=UPI001890106C|nr:uncharacterized protein LOC115452868 isoform X2 [Manduca sexta]